MSNDRKISIIMIFMAFLILCNFALSISQRYGFVSQIPHNLPVGAYNLTDHGKGWYSFQLDIDGKHRLFLCRISSVHLTLTELEEASNGID